MRISLLGLSLISMAFVGCQLVSGLSGLETQPEAGTTDAGAADAAAADAGTADAPVDLCKDAPCGLTGTCKLESGKAVCTCGAGFETKDNGASCVDACTAASTPCSSDAKCISGGPAKPTCKCNAGFGGDGQTCTKCDNLSSDGVRCWAVFDIYGERQPFQVPIAVNSVEVLAWGAGGAGLSQFRAVGGAGGFATARISVTPLSNLSITVGEGGRRRLTAGVRSAGGGGAANVDRGGGGGASRVQLLDTSLLVAGGGGGAGANRPSDFFASPGGHAGGAVGFWPRGNCTLAGAGGSQTEGGTRGGGSATGLVGVEGALALGGAAYIGSTGGGGGGGGGGGYWGGGGGGDYCGGGGGSSYFAPSVSGGVIEAGSGITPPRASSTFYRARPVGNAGALVETNTAVGGSQMTNTEAQTGGHGLVVILW